MKYCSYLGSPALAIGIAIATGACDPSEPTSTLEDSVVPVIQSCPSAAGYAASPPSLFATIDPVALLSGAPSVCAAPTAASPCAPHKIYKPNAAATTRTPLVVFLPGTNMEPDKHDVVLATAAYAGYRTIGLAYDNRIAVDTACSGVACNLNCPGLARREAVLGNNLSPNVAISRGDSILERLYRVLVELDTVDPMGGWSSYYVPTMGNINASNIVWSNVIIGGFSQGAGHAAYISHWLAVHGMLILDGANDTCGPIGAELVATWTSGTPDASSGRPKYLVAHDHNMMPFMHALEWPALGLGSTATSLDSTTADLVDTDPPPLISYTTQVSLPEPPAPPICSEHMSMARDQCLPADVGGTIAATTPPTARLFAPYLRRFCYACDAATCP